jgi:hypothetical protein
MSYLAIISSHKPNEDVILSFLLTGLRLEFFSKEKIKLLLRKNDPWMRKMWWNKNKKIYIIWNLNDKTLQLDRSVMFFLNVAVLSEKPIPRNHIFFEIFRRMIARENFHEMSFFERTLLNFYEKSCGVFRRKDIDKDLDQNFFF